MVQDVVLQHWWGRSYLLNQHAHNSKLQRPDLQVLNHSKVSPPHVVVAECTPTVTRRHESRPPTRPLGSCGECGSQRPIPKSASFTPETEHQRIQNSQTQVNTRAHHRHTTQPGVPSFLLPKVRMSCRELCICTLFPDDREGIHELHPTNGKLHQSVCALCDSWWVDVQPPRLLELTRFLLLYAKGHKNMEHLGPFPEVFLTVGAPGDNLVIPLSPVPGRPLSLNLNLVPKEGAMCSSNRASPRRARSRPSTPNKRASNIDTDEDCFSVIEKGHTAQLQKKATPGQKQKKGKAGAKKDKKDSGSKWDRYVL